MEGRTCTIVIMLSMPLMYLVKADDCHSVSDCSVTCGTGTQRMKCYPGLDCASGDLCPRRRVKRAAYYTYDTCREECCRVDCSWGQWKEFGPCSKTCGGGTQVRSRTKYSQSCGGSACGGSSTQSRSCNTGCCPVNCAWGPWGEYESCSKPCGGGTQVKKRSKATYESCGGSVCAGSSTFSKACNPGCCPVDCKWKEWGAFGNCSEPCGGGIYKRTRKTDPAECNGSSCTGSSTDSDTCNEHCCPVNCDWNDWGSWGSCSTSCGSGTTTRTRTISRQSSCGGTCSGSNSNSTSCEIACCPVDCIWGNWNMWGSCSKTCGTGSRTRNRYKVMNETCGGTCAGQNSNSQTCNTHCCPVDCTWKPWSPWGACEDSCGAAIRRRTRRENPAVCEGEICHGEKEETQTCDDNVKEGCPVNCEWSQWSPWNSCSVSCGFGERKRLRTKHVVEKNGGSCFGPSEESETCEKNMNPTDCALDAWGSWEECKGSCDTGGIKVRSREVIQNPTACGKPCNTNQLDHSACVIDGCLGTTSGPSDDSKSHGENTIGAGTSGLSTRTIIIIGVAGFVIIVIVLSIVAVICRMRKKADRPSATPTYDDLRLDGDVIGDTAYTELQAKETAVYEEINK